MKTHILGFPRIGPKRELKFALESFWKERITKSDLIKEGNKIKELNWKTQNSAGLSFVSTGDFSFYDHVLDTMVMLNAIPKRFIQEKYNTEDFDLRVYFNMARGDAQNNIPAMEMTKWFNTNYHYIVPEFSSSLQLEKKHSKIIEETKHAKKLGYNPKPALLGPLTFLHLGKEINGFNRWNLLEQIVSIYCEIIKDLSNYAEWIQIDEPILCTDMSEEAESFIPYVLKRLSDSATNTNLMLTTYFGDLGNKAPLVLGSGFSAIHIDMFSSSEDLDFILHNLPATMKLSLGIVNGRNIWKTDLEKALNTLTSITKKIGEEKLLIGSSCSLMHCPVDLKYEDKLDEKLKSWMSFAVQKCREIAILGEALLGKDLSEELKLNKNSIESRRTHPNIFRKEVRERINAINEEMLTRSDPYPLRRVQQRKWLHLPLFPTTTIGSFPQTQEIRKTRLKFRRNEISEEEYKNFLKEQIKANIEIQEKLGLDVFVHGEPERNDMVEYFGQQLEGFCFTENGWVQSYGSRCVKPPIIYGDVSRPKPMTVEWITYAQSLTTKPVKGMLTGPVTILCWSFVRDDLERSEVCKQIALAIRDEVKDLEEAGIGIIQIDEAAFREGMPLQKRYQEEYLQWAVNCFRIASSVVKNETQIHSHMCYSEFNDIIPWIAKMDADVISIEASRSNMELLEAFRKFNYPNEIGPGVYDIHSPRVPSVEEIVSLLEKALEVIEPTKLWVNPDCGLKTREWDETIKSLKNMVEAAKRLRKKYDQ